MLRQGAIATSKITYHHFQTLSPAYVAALAVRARSGSVFYGPVPSPRVEASAFVMWKVDWSSRPSTRCTACDIEPFASALWKPREPEEDVDGAYDTMDRLARRRSMKAVTDQLSRRPA